MVLYEDLRIYTIWRTALTKQSPDPAEHQKSAEEWEILGELADRLHHFPEAVEAYQSCLRVRFSPKAMKGVLHMYERQGRYTEMLRALIRLIAWQYRWYSEVCSDQLDFFVSYFISFTNVGCIGIGLVLTRPVAHHPQVDRKRRCGQGAQYRASNKLAPARARSHPSLRGALRYIPLERQRWLRDVLFPNEIGK